MPRVKKTPPAPEPTPQAAYLGSDERRAHRAPIGHHPPFILAHRPDAWEVSSGRVVPSLSRYIVQDGVNGSGNTYDRRGRVTGVDPGLLRANLSAWGKREIPHSVDGPGTSYMTQPYPGHYVDRWTTLYEGTARVSYDQAGYDEWRASLVSRGVIDPPRRPALEALEQRMASSYDALAERVGGLPAQMQTGSHRELERLREALKVVREAIEGLGDTPGRAISAENTEASV